MCGSGGYIDKLDNGWEVYGVGQDLFGTLVRQSVENRTCNLCSSNVDG